MSRFSFSLSTFVVFALAAGSAYGTNAAQTAQNPQPLQSQAAVADYLTGWHLPGWQFSLTEGWQSQYIYRGEDLTPGADGLFTSDLDATVPGFEKGQSLTLGAWAGIQMGTANYAGVPWKINGTEATGPKLSHDVGTVKYYRQQAWTKQNSFRELDLTANYKMELGHVLVAEVGDTKYFSDYDAVTTVHLHRAPSGYVYVATKTRYQNDNYSSGASSENRNEIYLKLGTNPKWFDWVVPSVTYCETFNQRETYQQFTEFSSYPPKAAYPVYYRGRFRELNAPLYGGYLESRVDGHLPWIRRNNLDVFGLRPYAQLSYSFNDEVEGTRNYGRKFFTDWNNVEIGTDAPWQVNQYLVLTASVAVSHGFKTPVASTSSNEVWAGVRAAVTF